MGFTCQRAVSFMLIPVFVGIYCFLHYEDLRQHADVSKRTVTTCTKGCSDVVHTTFKVSGQTYQKRYTNATRCCTETTVAREYAAMSFWPLIALVCTILYTFCKNDHRARAPLRAAVVFTTIVIMSVIFNLWQMQTKERRRLFTEDSKKLFKQSYKLALSYDEWGELFTFMCTNPRYTVYIGMLVIVGSFLHMPTEDLATDKKYSQGHWSGVATQLIAVMMTCWYVHIMKWQNMYTNIVHPQGVSDVLWDNIYQLYRDPLVVFDIPTVYHWLRDIPGRMVQEVQQIHQAPEMSFTPVDMTVSMILLFCFCLAVCVYFPSRSGKHQSVIIGPCARLIVIE